MAKITAATGVPATTGAPPSVRLSGASLAMLAEISNGSRTEADLQLFSRNWRATVARLNALGYVGRMGASWRITDAGEARVLTALAAGDMVVND